MRPELHAPRSGPRRDLLIAGAAALVGGGVAIVAASGGGSRGRVRRQGITAAQADVAVLVSLLALEQRQIAAYTGAAPHLGGAARNEAATFLVQEQQHAAALRSAIGALGAPLPNTQGAVLPPHVLSKLRHERGALAYLAAVERMALTAYSGAVEGISTEDARVTAAAILATEAEHLAVLTGTPGSPRLSGAFAGIDAEMRRA